MNNLLLLLACYLTFLCMATCHPTTFDIGKPRKNSLLNHLVLGSPGSREQSSILRQRRQNTFFSSDDYDEIPSFGNSQPNTGGFNWGSNQNNLNDGGRRQDGFVFENDYNDFQPSVTQRPSNPPSVTRRPNNPQVTQGPTSTVAVPGMATTRSACEDACPATSQFDPVCGDNNVTYININWLNCAQSCGRNVNVKYMGSCPRVP